MPTEPAFYRISIKALVKDEQGRILLARETSGKWDLLGGGLDHGEEPLVGLRRELQEEAGLTAVTIAPSPTYFLTAVNEQKGSHIANVLYEVTLENLDFVPSDECQELRFFTPEQIQPLDLHANGQEFARLLNIDKNKH